MKAITFQVQGEPKGQPRPRAFAFRGKARLYNPATAEAWKSAIAAAWLASKPPDFVAFVQPVKIRLRFFMPRPKSHFHPEGRCPKCRGKGEVRPSAFPPTSICHRPLVTCGCCGGTGRLGVRLRENAPKPHVAKPDIDNLTKAVMDALTALLVWKDDALVVGCDALKVYADGLPGLAIEVTEVEEIR